MKKFEVGKKYFYVSICDSSSRTEYKVIKRTDKSVWLENGKRFGIKTYTDQYDNEYEWIYPEGKYSMCPILKALREVK